MNDIHQSSKYVYERQVIKLTHRDYRRWSEAFAGGDDIRLSGWLEERDDWLASPQCKSATRDKWFITTAKWLESKRKERLNAEAVELTPAEVEKWQRFIRMGVKPNWKFRKVLEANGVQFT